MLNVILLIVFVLFTPDGRILLNPNLVPKSGEKLEDFVPNGWKIEQQIEGDLNHDSLPDTVLQLIEAKPEKDSQGDYQDRYRALLILLKTKDGKFSRAGVANKLIQCTSCGGMLGFGGAGADLKIKNGVLIVSQFSGSREAREVVQLFRYASNNFYLIGEDSTMRDRAMGSSTATSTNFLTGKQIIEKRQYNQKLDRDALLSKRTKVVAKKRQLFEDIDSEK